MKTRSGMFALVMGIVMAFVWIALIATAQYDFQSAPLESASLMAAEALTALALIAGGIGILAQKAWGTAIHIASLGMMLYTSANSIGVFAQAGITPASIFFAVLTLVTIGLILAWARRSLL
jgi:hypothetical protein